MVSLPDETQSSTRSSWAGLSLDSCSSRNPTDQLTLPKIELFMCSSTWTDCLWMGCSAQMKWLILCIMNTSAPVSCFLSEWHHATLLLCVMHYFFQLKQYVDGYLFIYLIEMCEKVSKRISFHRPSIFLEEMTWYIIIFAKWSVELYSFIDQGARHVHVLSLFEDPYAREIQFGSRYVFFSPFTLIQITWWAIQIDNK